MEGGQNMTIRKTRKIYKESSKEFISKNRKDVILLNEDYMAFLDCLCKDGEITQKQYDNAPNLFKRK